MLIKNCFKIKSSSDERIVIHLAIDQATEILKKITEHNTKFERIINSIFRNIQSRDFYEKYKNYPGTSVMKISKGRKGNFRIYCKIEQTKNENGQAINNIIMVHLHSKKNTELSKKEIAILNKIQQLQFTYYD